jgi:hypothetical protein
MAEVSFLYLAIGLFTEPFSDGFLSIKENLTLIRATKEYMTPEVCSSKGPVVFLIIFFYSANPHKRSSQCILKKFFF